jgi:pimeloyl-ACP methyl ester carboxylesterase
MAKSGVPELAVNGTILQYAEFGAGSTVVVSAQQEFGTPNFLERLEDAHVYAIRLRRLSKTDEEPGEDLEPRWYARWAADVCAATQALGLRDFVYTGVSHGAVIGWHLAVEHPGLLQSLAAIVGVPPPRARSSSGPSGRASQMAARQDAAALRSNVERLFGPTTDPARRARQQRMIDERVRRVLATPLEEAAVNLGIGFPDVKTDDELAELLAGVGIPTLVIGGMHDPWVTPERLLWTARRVRDCKLVIYGDESHLLATESPARVAEDINLFIRSARSRTE